MANRLGEADSNSTIPGGMKGGTATLSAGSKVVNDSSVTATCIILVVGQGGLTNLGALSVSSRVNGTSFTVTSTNVLDARTFGYFLFEP